MIHDEIEDFAAALPRDRALAGLDLGERVVTVGAYQVRLASLSGRDFAGGHGH